MNALDVLSPLIANREDWLLRRVLGYAKAQDYTRYTSILEEEWRTSIQGLSRAILDHLSSDGGTPELVPDVDHAGDPLSAFGIHAARLHRKRGLSLAVLLGLMKYYRQAYLDLVDELDGQTQLRKDCELYLLRVFDRMELSLCTEWASHPANAILDELQAANRDLTNERSKLLTLFRSQPMPAVFVTADGQIDLANHAAARLLHGAGTAGDYAYGDPLAVEAVPWLAGLLADAAQQDCVTLRRDIRLSTQDDPRVFEAQLDRMSDTIDRYSGTMVTLTDITDRLQHQVDAQRREAELRTIFDAVLHAFAHHRIVVDESGAPVDYVFLEVNDGFERQTGLRREDVIGHLASEVIPGLVDEGFDWIGTYGRVALTGTPARFEQYLATFGRWYYVSAFSSSPGHFTTLFEDITERKQAEDAVRSSEERYRSLFDTMMEGFAHCEVVRDDEGRVVDWVYLDVNQAFGDLTRLQDVVGRRATEILPTIREQSPELFEIYGRVATTGQGEKFEIHFEPLNVWLRIAVHSPARDRFVAVFENTTERKRAETETARLNRLLGTLSDVNQTVVRVDGQAELFEQVCDIAVQRGGFQTATILLAPEDGVHFVHAAHRGTGSEHLASLDLRADDSPRGQTPSALAFRTGTRQIADDVTRFAGLDPIRETLSHMGISSAGAFPLFLHGRTVGVLSLTSAEPGFFGEAEVALIDEMAADISFALGDFERERCRQEAEAALRESESRYYSVFEQSAVGLSVTALDGTHVDCNATLANMLGLTRDEARRIKADEITHPDDRGQDSSLRRELLAGERTHYQRETRYLHKDGRVIWVRLTVSLALDGDGKPCAAISVIEDITERVLAEAALADSEKQFRRAFEMSAIGMSLTGPDGTPLQANRAFCEMLGRTAEEVTRCSVSEITHPDDVALSLKVMRQLTDGEIDRVRFEKRFVRPDGSVVWADTHSFLIRHADGSPRHFVTHVQDITQDKLARLEIARLNRTLATLSDVNQMIVRVEDESELFDNICRIAVERGGFRLAAILATDDDGEHLAVRAQYGHDDGYLGTLDTHVDGLLSGARPSATVLRTGEYQVCNDIEHDPEFAPYRDVALQRGHGSTGAFPLFFRGRVFGALTLYHSEPGFFDSAETRLLDEMAADVSFALETFDRQRRRRAAEEALAQEKRRFQELADMLPQVVFEADADGAVTYVNRVGSESFGYAREDLFRKPRVTDMLVPEDREAAQAAMRRAMGGEAISVREEFLALRKDGSTFPAIVSLSAIVKDGSPVGVRGIVVDITEHKRAEEELRSSQSIAWGLLNAIQDVALLTDAQGRLLGANAAAGRSLGMPPDAIIGKMPEDLLPAGIASTRRRHLARAIATGEPESWEDVRVGKVFVNTVYPVLDGSDAVSRLAIFCQDVTELRHAQDSARLATVGQLAAGVAHDFNNILAAMMMRAELLELAYSEADGRRLAATVRNLGARGADICKNLMGFARPAKPRREVTYIEAATESALAIHARQMEAIGVVVRRDYDPESRRVHIDASQMEQVFLNLVINACHAMPHGGTLTIRTRYDTAVDTATVVVSDTGCGIPPEHLSRIFEPFFTTKGRLGESDTPGSGLGLAVSHGTIAAHGGTTTVQSEMGVGTTFCIRLPLAPPADSTESASEEGVASCPESPIEGLRVLVLDDDDGFRQRLCQVMGQRGIRSHEAGSVELALRILAGEHFHLVVADMMMPDGGAAALLRRLPAGQDRPQVLAVTGAAPSMVAESLLAQGAVCCAQKSQSLAEMVHVVERCLRKCCPSGPRATAAPAADDPSDRGPRLRSILLADDEEALRGSAAAALESAGYGVIAVANTDGALQTLQVDAGIELVVCDLMMPGGGARRLLEAVAERKTAPPVIVITGRLEQRVEDELMAAGAAMCLQKPFSLSELLWAVREALPQ